MIYMVMFMDTLSIFEISGVPGCGQGMMMPVITRLSIILPQKKRKKYES